MLRWIALLLCVAVFGAMAVSAWAAPVHEAAAAGDSARVQSMINTDPNLANKPDEAGATPLHWAVYKNQRAIVELLLSHEADVNASKKDGVTPLHIATAINNIDLVKLLVDRGARRGAVDKKGRTPLTIAESKGYRDIAELLSGGAEPAPSFQPGVGSIFVSVSDGRGAPLEGVAVSTGREGSSALTSAEGNATLRGLDAGIYTVTAEKAGYEAGTQEGVTVSGDDYTRIGFELKATLGMISGTVRDSSGIGVSGASVVVDGGKASATTGPGGGYSITGVEPGPRVVTVIVDGKEAQARPGVSVTAGSTITVDFSLPPPPFPLARIAFGVLTALAAAAAVVVVAMNPRWRRKKVVEPQIAHEPEQPRHGAVEAQVIAGDEVYPWNVPPEMVAKAGIYETQGQFRAFAGTCGEVLNTATRTAAGVGVLSELRAYPDMVGVTGRPLGCLGWLLLLIAMLLSLIAFLINLPFLIFSPIQLFLSLISVVVHIILYPFLRLLAFLTRKLISEPAARLVRDNPKSWLSIWILYMWTPLTPRFWKSGDVVQIVRVDVRWFFFWTRSLVLFMQDRALPKGIGCLNFLGIGILPRRRIYALRVSRGGTEADAAADEAARSLGLEVQKAVFVRSRLVIP